MVDLLTVVPIWVTINQDPIPYNDIHTSYDGFLYLMFGLNTTRVLRSLRIHKRLMLSADEVHRSVGTMALSILAMLMFSKWTDCFYTILLLGIESYDYPSLFPIYLFI